jgi:hypothetical protein
VPGGPENWSAYFQRLLIFESSGIAVCKPAPDGSSFKRIVNAFVDVLIAVTSYSLKSSTDTVFAVSE